MNQRHTEFFGPDLGRGPFSSQRIETSALQIATALAQLRAPLGRSEQDLRTHADLIRELADRLAPDWAAGMNIRVDGEIGNAIHTAILAPIGAQSLLRVWLADAVGGGETAFDPAGVTFTSGQVLQTITPNRHWLVLTTGTGTIDVTVSFTGVRTWYWAVCRYGRVYFSDRLGFTALPQE